ALPWPKRAGARAARVAGAHVVVLGGEPALFVERGGRSLVPLREPDEAWLRPALAALVEHVRSGGAKRLAGERFDARPVIPSSRSLGENLGVSLLASPSGDIGPATFSLSRTDSANTQRSPVWANAAAERLMPPEFSTIVVVPVRIASKAPIVTISVP